MSIDLAEPLINLERCPQCKAYKPTLNLVFQCVDSRKSGRSHGPGWLVYRCSACYDITAFLVPSWQTFTTLAQAISHLNQVGAVGVVMIPNSEFDITGLPERAGNYLSQAANALSAPDGAVMLAGSAVDAMLKEKGYDQGSVYDRINKAVEHHVLTTDMAEWAHSVRLGANKPRHADLDDPHATEAEARQSLEFAKALGDFLFVFPARVAAGKQAAEKAAEV